MSSNFLQSAAGIGKILILKANSNLRIVVEETNPDEKFRIELKVAEILSRLEEIQKPTRKPIAAATQKTSTPPQRATSPTRGSADDSINFEVVVQIDKVNVFVLHQNQPRKSINDGSFPVRILKGESTNAQGTLEQIVFLQLTDSVYFPLNQSIPCLRISPGHYVLPREDASFYGLRFPSYVTLQKDHKNLPCSMTEFRSMR